MKIRWTPSAEADLVQVHNFVAEDNLRAADGLIEKFYNTAMHLGQFPRLGKIGRVKGTRELVIPGTWFYLSYRIDDDEVQVLAVVHGARRRPSSRA
jgi:toxin ParE1/3/4